MTVSELQPVQVGDPTVPTPDQRLDPEVRAVLDTTELRWFLPGSLPLDLLGWFTGSTGVVEERCDTYLLHGRHDMGVKRRFGETLELKVRRGLDGSVQLGDGLIGPLEVWRRWSPAEGLVDVESDGRWVDVCKTIVKRRFSVDGAEMAYSSTDGVVGTGCDVEVAAVNIGPAKWWTFAFAAVGLPSTRRDALLACWQRLSVATPCPTSFGLRTGRAMGYPEWLGQMFA